MLLQTAGACIGWHSVKKGLSGKGIAVLVIVEPGVVMVSLKVVCVVELNTSSYWYVFCPGILLVGAASVVEFFGRWGVMVSWGGFEVALLVVTLSISGSKRKIKFSCHVSQASFLPVITCAHQWWFPFYSYSHNLVIAALPYDFGTITLAINMAHWNIFIMVIHSLLAQISISLLWLPCLLISLMISRYLPRGLKHDTDTSSSCAQFVCPSPPCLQSVIHASWPSHLIESSQIGPLP